MATENTAVLLEMDVEMFKRGVAQHPCSISVMELNLILKASWPSLFVNSLLSKTLACLGVNIGVCFSWKVPHFVTCGGN